MLTKIKQVLEYKEQVQKGFKVSIFDNIRAFLIGLGCFQLFQICESIYSFFK